MSTVVKVLSIRQPWAWLVVSGLKDVENRTWTTDYRGVVYIHAGKTFDWGAIRWLFETSAAYPSLVGVMWQVLSRFGLDASDASTGTPPTRHQEELGALVGKATLCDVTDGSDSVWAEPGCWYWCFRDPKAITPVPMPGRLGLYEIPALALQSAERVGGAVNIRNTP